MDTDLSGFIKYISSRQNACTTRVS